MAFLNMDWGSKGGQFYELWKLSPCCGSPVNVGDGLYCCCSWWCLGTCNSAQLFASSVDQECAIVNHFIPACCCAPIVSVLTRHNLRRKYGIGGDSIMDWVGDVVCVWFCGLCTGAQQLRASQNADWDWLGVVKTDVAKALQVSVEPIKMIR